MSQWQSGSVMANGIKIHYTRTGGDKPAVVLKIQGNEAVYVSTVKP